MGRRQGQQELLDAGITDDAIKRWCKYIYDEQTSSYILNIPIAPMLQRAGYNPFQPRQMIAAHLTVDVSHLIVLILPSLVEYESAVITAMKASPSFTNSCFQRLYTSAGAYSAIRFAVETFLQCAAARPRNSEFMICMDAAPLYQQFASHNNLFQHHIFQTSEFLDVAKLVDAAEQREMANFTPGHHLCTPRTFAQCHIPPPDELRIVYTDATAMFYIILFPHHSSILHYVFINQYAANPPAAL